MKTCPKCHRSYDDGIDFCLRDGKPLVGADATVAEGGAAREPSRREPPIAATLKIKTWEHPKTSPSSPGTGRTLSKEAPWAPNELAAASEHPGGKVEAARVEPWVPPREVLPGGPVPPKDTPPGDTIVPWVPGRLRESSVSGIRLTMPVGLDSQKPPWETAEPIPLRKVVVAPPSQVDETPAPAYSEAAILTPDLPVPPPEREAAVPVGDETILVVEADEEEFEVDGLELEEVVPPPAPELPLEARYCKAAAMARSGFWGPCPGPPVQEDESEPRPRVLIHTEDVFEPPDPDDEDAVDPDAFVVYWQGKRVTPEGKPLEAPARARWKSRYLLLAALVALVIIAGSAVLGSREAGKEDGGQRPPAGETVQVETVGARKLDRVRPANVGAKEPARTWETPKVVPPGAGEILPATEQVPGLSTGTEPSGGQGQEGRATPGSMTVPGEDGGEERVAVFDAPLPSQEDGRVAQAPGSASSLDAAEVPEDSTGARHGEAAGQNVASPSVAQPEAPNSSSEQEGVAEMAPASTADAPAGPVPAVVREGTIILHSTPQGAAVYVDGKHYGSTPLTITATLGRHNVRVEKEGYKAAETVLTIDRPDAGQVSVSLEAQPVAKATPKPTFRLLVSSNAIGADVFVDGTRRGPAPLSVVLEAGTHTVKVAPEGKTPKEETVTVTPSEAPNHIERRHFQF